MSPVQRASLFHLAVLFALFRASISDIHRENLLDDALFLTPYIESGQIREAQKLATVTPFLKCVKSFSGYLTVNKSTNSNIFFWLYKSQQGDWEDRPLLVWLQGGPCDSSFNSMFLEVGPFTVQFRKREKRQAFDDGRTLKTDGSEPKNQQPTYPWDEDFKLKCRKYAWNRRYNMVFMDVPVGSGFSFTENDSGYAKNLADVTRDLIEALTQLYQLFPTLQKNKLFILGESYAGKFAVSAARKLYQLNQNSSNSENRKVVPVPAGLIGLSPVLDVYYITRHGDTLHNVGLLDEQQLREFHSREEVLRAETRAGNYAQAGELWLRGRKRMEELTGFDHLNDLTRENLGGSLKMPGVQFANRTDVRKTLHAGHYAFHSGAGTKAKSVMAADTMRSAKSELEELLTLEPFPIIFFGGQLDIVSAYSMTSNFYDMLEWPYAMDYHRAKRCHFKVGNRVAAYYRKVGSFTEVLIRNVGHLIASTEPRWAFKLMETFIENGTAFRCP